MLQFILKRCAKNAGGISRHSLLSANINMLPWQRPLRNRKKRSRSIVCSQSASYG